MSMLIECEICGTLMPRPGFMDVCTCPQCGAEHAWYESIRVTGSALKAALAPKLCKTCKRWDDLDGSIPNRRGCDSPKLSSSYLGQDGLEPTDGFVCVVTGPDFGCIHHKEKE